MRIRNKTVVDDSVTIPANAAYGDYSYTCASASGSSTNGSFITPGVVITDDTYMWMKDEYTRKGKPNPVTHYKSRLTLKKDNTSTSSGTTAFGGGYITYANGNTPFHALRENSAICSGLRPGFSDGVWITPRVVTTLPALNDRVEVARLYKRAQNLVVDGLLNLAESHEIPSAITGFAGGVKSLKTIWNQPNFNSKLSSLRSNYKKLAGGHLAYSFGIAPLIADINKIRAYLARIEKDYQKYVNVLPRTVSSSFDGDFVLNDAPTDYSTGKADYQLIPLVQPKVRYVLTYREKCPYNTAFMKKLAFLMNRFGSSGPASFAWERIPFSFVVDWFIDTSTVVDYLDSALQNDRFETISLTKSTKSSYELLVDYSSADLRSAGVYLGSRRCGSIVNSQYERLPLARAGIKPEASNRFGKKQNALAVSLLLQNLT